MRAKTTLFLLISFIGLTKLYSQTITAVATPSTCAANGKIELTASGIPEPIIYGIAKSPYTAADVISSTSPVFSFLEPGNYYYGYYNGANFVPSSSAIAVANQNNTTSPTFSTYYSYNYAYCGSVDPGGTIFTQITGGNKTYLVELLNSSSTVIQQIQTTVSSSSATFNGVPVGVYTLRATDVCGTVVYAPNAVTVKANVPYSDFTLATVNSQPSTSFFNVVYNTPDDVCSGIKSASVGYMFSVLGLGMTDVTTPGAGAPTFYGPKNPVYKLEIQNASGGFDVYDNLTATQISSGKYSLPNDRSKWGIIKATVTLCGISKTNQLDLALYNEFRIKPFTYVGFTIYDDATPAACTPPSQVELWTNLYQSGGCPQITLDVTENGTSNTQHYELPFNFKLKLDIGKSYTIVAKDGTGAVLPSYSFRNATTSSSSKPSQSDPNNLYIDPAYFTPKSIRDKITFTDGLSGKNIGKSALVVNNLTTALGLIAPVYIETVSGPSVINLKVTPTAGSYNIGVGNNLTPGTYKIRIRDSQCFSEEFDITLASYIVSVELQNVTSEPSTTICDRYIKKGQVKVTTVGTPYVLNGPINTVYGYDYAYPRILSAPAGASSFSTSGNFLLINNAVIPFSFTADLPGDYQIALSRKADSRLLLPSEVFENTTPVPLTATQDFPAFDMSQSGGVICPGNTTGSLTVKINNAAGTITYFVKKDTDADFPATGQTAAVFTGLAAGNYVVKAKTLCYEVVQSFRLATLAQLTDVIFGDNTYCSGASLHFSTAAVGPVTSIVWTLPDNSTVTGNTLNVSNLTPANSGEYKVTINSTAGCTVNGSTTVTVNALPEVQMPIFNALSPSVICQSVNAQQSDYTASAVNATAINYSISPPEAGTITAGIVNWNSSFHGTATITAIASGCGTDETANFTVTVSPRADVLEIITEDRSICPNETGIILEALAPNISNPIFTWYDSNLASGSILAVDDNLVVSPTSTTTYYVGVEGSDLCVNEAGNRKAVTVTIKPLATVLDIIVSDQTICQGETAALTASSPLINPVFTWYTDAALENSISNVATIDVKPNVTTTYYVTVEGDGVCALPPPAKAVTVTVNQLPVAAISYNGSSYCDRGTATVTLTGTAGGTFSSDAGLVLNATTGEINLASSTVGVHTISYAFTDGTCPNTVSADITINATVLPAILSDINEECSATPTAPTLTDPCAGTITATTQTSFPITAQGATAITWTFDYGEGYTKTVIQNVVIKDTTKPVKPVLADVTAECEVLSIMPPTTTDNCAGTVTGTTQTAFPITVQGTTEVTWTFDDGNGNMETAFQNVIIKDIIKPVKPVLADVTAECEVLSITPPTTTDNCAGTVTGTTLASFPITAQGTTEVIWTFNDGNGNTETAVQNVIIKDITKPVKPVLGDVTAECEVLSITPPTTTDNCAGTVTGTTLAGFPITTQGTTEVTWIFDDGNGNTETAVQNVIIKDITKPLKPVLADVTAECEVLSITPPTTTDNCAGTVTGTTLTNFPITTQGATEVIWTFDDGNGNTETAVQNVIIKDTTKPVKPVLADVTAECEVLSITPPTTTDNCAGTVTGTTQTVFPITVQGTTEVTWTFDDGNGNTETAVQNVIIKDVTKPVKPVLADVTSECEVASITAPTATDNCAGTVTGTTQTVFPITAQGTTEVIWTFDDGNGNTETAVQNVVIKDITKPVKPVLADVTAECEVLSITAPTTTDNCAGTVTGTTLASFPITTQGTTEVIWTFDDGNGNTETAVQNVVIKDITKPLKPVLADVTAECEVLSITAPTTTDNCAGTVTGTTLINFPITTQGTTEVTWTFDDGNGNTETAVQNVVIKDITKPLKPVLADIAAECEVASITAPATTDNCAGTVTGTTLASFPITTQGTTEVTWIFDDGNGNTETAVQNVVIKDITKPLKPVLADVTAECEVLSITPPTAIDNCAGTVTGTTQTVFPITAQGTTEVTWTFNDGNGNTETSVQNVIIKDITKPVKPVLADVTAECEVLSITAPTTTDNCAGTITGTTLAGFPITAQGTTEVTWTFNDGNGNTETAVQNVIIKDITKPVKPVLADVTAECEVLSITPPTTTDNCAGTVTGTTLTNFPITTQGPTEVIWTFDDGNGNTETAVQNVIIKDTTKPVKPVLADVTAECEVASITAPTTTDNCAGTVTGTTQTVFPITTQGTTEVTWTFNDGNGNTETAVQNVIIKDITKPVKPVLADVTAECEVLSIMPPTTTDNCAGTVTGTTLTSFPITEQGTTEVTWTFDDGNGNTETAIQNVIIKDVTKPLQPILADISAECEVASITAPRTTDNCSGTVTGTTLTSFPITAQGTTEVIWTFDDGNGNTETSVQKVIIKDLTAPVVPILANVTDQCSVTLQAPTAIDNCNGIITGKTTTTFPVTEAGTTTVLWTFDDGNGNIATAQQKIVINTIELIATEKATCLTNKPEYVVTLSVSGQAPFTVVGTGAPGTWFGNNWTSDVINGGTNYSINIQDQYKCNTLNVEGVSPNCCVFDVVCPTFPSQTVSCADDLPTATSLTTAQFEALGNGNGKITNNCGVIEIKAENSQNQGCNAKVVRTYTITEFEDTNNNGIHDAGENTILNTSTCTQIITVNDTTAPVFAETLPPAVINADCDNIPDPVILTATDNCNTAAVTYNEEKIDGDCSGRYSQTRTWTAVDECGNKNIFTQTVNVSCMETVYNAVSPNGDGINDTFVIKNIDCFPNNKVEIYNRYGILIYSKKGYDNVTDPFDGFSSGRATVIKKDMIPTGTYFYILEYEDNGKQIQKSGYLYVNTQ